MAYAPSTDGVAAVPTTNKKRLASALAEAMGGFYQSAEETNTAPAADTAPAAEHTGSGYRGRRSGGGSASSGTAFSLGQLPAAASQEEYIQAIYDEQRRAQEEALRSAYESNVLALEQQKQQIAPTYQAAANQAAVQSELNRAAFNEQAAAAGLNTGAAGQAALARQNALQGNLTAIRWEEAQALNDLETQRNRLTAEYKSAIAQALAENDLKRAEALYEEAKRVDESMVETAYRQAQLDYKVWAKNQ